MHVTYHASDETETLDTLLLGELEEIAYWQKMYAEEGKGLMAHKYVLLLHSITTLSFFSPALLHSKWSINADAHPSGIDAGIKIRPTAAERATIGPAFAAYWDEFFEGAPDKPLLAISCSASP